MGNQGFENNEIIYDTEAGGEAVIAGQSYAAQTYANGSSARTVNAADAVSFKKYGLIALIYALVHTICLYQNTDGIAYPVSMAGTILLLAWARKKDGLSILKDKNGKCGLNLFFIISLMLLSISKCTTANYQTLWIDGFAINVLMFCFLLHMYVDTKNWDIVGWFIGIVITVLRPLINIVDPIRDLIEWFTSQGKTIDSEKRKNLVAVVLGLCIAVPLLAIVLSLLASADAVFSNTLEHAFDFFVEIENIWDIVAVSWMMVWSVWLFYTVIKSLSKNGEIRESANNSEFNPVVAITFSSLLCVVYLFFSVIQILFLFMGNMTLPENYTYAEYAHEGFTQLLFVALMNLVMVTLCQRLFKESLALKIILTIVGFCTYIMIASSAFRMIMYIKAYNLTYLRVFVLWFLMGMSFCLAYLMIGLFNKKLPVFHLCMITVTVMYLIFAFSNPDYHVARYDMAHMNNADLMEPDGDSMGFYLINEISEDAVPAYVGNEKLLTEFSNSLDHDYHENKGEYKEIRGFNFSKYKAYKILNGIKK